VTIAVIRSTAPAFVIALLFGAGSLAGCGKSGAPEGGERPRLRTVISLYNMSRSDAGRPPANEEEFKAFITSKGAAAVERLEVKSADEILISERDGKPFVVMYGKPQKGMDPDIIAYEQEGVDGKRQLGRGTGLVELVDEARLRELVPSPPAKN
jgi:hypothetical protein